MRTDPGSRPRAIAALLVVATILFVVGVAAEPTTDTHTDEPSGEAAEHVESAEKDEERVLGLDLESPGPVALAVVLSAVLAAAVLWRPDRRVLLVVALGATAFAVLDIAEVAHQLADDRTGLALLAATIAAMHAAATALAARQLTLGPRAAPA